MSGLFERPCTPSARQRFSNLQTVRIEIPKRQQCPLTIDLVAQQFALDCKRKCGHSCAGCSFKVPVTDLARTNQSQKVNTTEQPSWNQHLGGVYKMTIQNSSPLSDDEAPYLADVLNKLENNEPPTDTDIENREAAAQKKLSEAGYFNKPITFGQAIGAHPLYHLSDEQIREELHKTRHDLARNCEITAHNLSLHLKYDEPVPPYFAERIAILLRKRRFPDIELRFLIAWNKHFGRDQGYGKSGARYLKLIERYEKLIAKQEE